MRRLRSLARRVPGGAVRTTRDLSLLPGVAPPEGRIRSLQGWVDEHPGAALVELAPRPSEIRGPPPRTVRGSPDSTLERLYRDGPPHRPVRVAVLPGARVATSHGVVVAPDNRIFEETAWDAEQLAASGLTDGHRLRVATRVAGTHATLISAWSDNYFHWLLDALPRLAVLDEAGFGELPLIVPDPPAAFHRESLDLLGIGLDRRTPFGGLHLEPDVLVWPSHAGHTGHPAGWACQWLRARLLPAARAVSGRRRLYVSRAAAPRRRLANEDEIVAVLEPLGFEAVEPHRLPLREQLSLFASAEAVVGPHGAGLANVLFGRRVSVLELLDPGYVNPCIYSLARVLGHDYRYVIGSPSGTSRDFTVEPGDVLESVGRMTGA